MKTKIAILLAVILCAGCGRNTDSAKIDALTQKVDSLLANQAVINNELEAVKSQVAAMPAAIDQTEYYYYTNSLKESERIISLATLAEQSANLTRQMDFTGFTNMASAQGEELKQLGIVNSLVVNQRAPQYIDMPALIQTEANVAVMQEYLIKIAARLGIY